MNFTADGYGRGFMAIGFSGGRVIHYSSEYTGHRPELPGAALPGNRQRLALLVAGGRLNAHERFLVKIGDGGGSGVGE